jgi:delta24-sterol reductase
MPDTLGHLEKVEKIQNLVKIASRTGKKVKIYHGSTNSTRKQSFDDRTIIDTSELKSILDIRPSKKRITVEPNVSMAELLDATLAFNLIPKVVPEFPQITVGGAVMGGAAESSAIKYGGFHESCTEYEVVLGNGILVTASPTNNPELFRELACSYGTLGILTSVTLELIDAKPFVTLTMETTQTMPDLSKVSSNNIDFYEAIVFSEDLAVSITGALSERNSLPIKRFSRRRDEWFSEVVHSIAKSGSAAAFQIPVRDYLFRYDRGAFWMAKYAFKFLHVPYNRLSRFICSPFCSTQYLYGKLHAANISQRYVIQDMCLPQKNVEPLISFCARTANIYPIWLLPIRNKEAVQPIFSPLTSIRGNACNVGMWGEVPKNQDFEELNRAIEAKLTSLSGRKTLYAHAYYTEVEFRSLYDFRQYARLRKKYHAAPALASIEEKVLVKERYKPNLARAFKSLFH